MLRWVIAAAVIIVAASWTTYVALRLLRTYEMEAQLVAMDSRLTAADQQIAVLTDALRTRMDVVERIVFGAWESLEDQVIEVSKKQAPTGVQVWQKNRDRELRERLGQLERELYRRDEMIRRLDRLIRDQKP